MTVVVNDIENIREKTGNVIFGDAESAELCTERNKVKISIWEINTRIPGFETLNTMRNLLQRNLDYIMDRSDDATSATQNTDTLEDMTFSRVADGSDGICSKIHLAGLVRTGCRGGHYPYRIYQLPQRKYTVLRHGVLWPYYHQARKNEGIKTYPTRLAARCSSDIVSGRDILGTICPSA